MLREAARIGDQFARDSTGDRHSERFCAASPVIGMIEYRVRGDSARLIARLRQVPANGLMGLAWSLGNGQSGEEIASAQVREGVLLQPSLRLLHAPFYDRIGTELLRTRNDAVIARMKRC